MATYRVPVLEDFAWQPPIDDQATNVTDHSDVSKGDRYIVIATGSDMFVGEEKNIATAKISGASAAADWFFDTPVDGHIVFDKSDNKTYRFDGSDWAAEDTTTMASQVLVLESEMSSVSVAVSNVSTGLSLAESDLLVEKSTVSTLSITQSQALSRILVLESEMSTAGLSHGSTASLVSALDADKQDIGTYVSEYGAIEFTM